MIDARVNQLLDALEDCLQLPVLEAASVHAIRVSCKQLRAWLRLLKPGLKSARWQVLDTGLRDLARALAPARDETATKATLDWLHDRSRGRKTRAACGTLREVLASPPALPARDLLPDPVNTRKLLQALREQAHILPAQAKLRKGLRKTHRKVLRCGMFLYAAAPDYVALHTLRKWTKHLAYELALLGTPASTARFHRRLRALGKRLGRLHDLVVLREQLVQTLPARYGRERALVARASGRELRTLLTRSRACFENIAHRKPRHLARQATRDCSR